MHRLMKALTTRKHGGHSNGGISQNLSGAQVQRHTSGTNFWH